MAKKRKKTKHYPNGGDGLFFYHKKTKHPAKQIAHTEKTWTNRRYTHSPNNLSNYKLDNELSTEDTPVHYHKSLFVDSIYTRGPIFKMKKNAIKASIMLIAEHIFMTQRLSGD